MRRHLLTFATVLSLIVCVATLALWVCSCWRKDGFVTADGSFDIRTLPHRMQVRLWHRPFPQTLGYYRDVPDRHFASQYPIVFGQGIRRYLGGGYSYSLAGFVYERSFHPWPPRQLTSTELAVPFWPVLMVATLHLAVWYRQRARAGVPGVCMGCGYDLRATPDRCPECGRVAERSVPEQVLSS